MAAGDALAKGAVKAQFPPAGGQVSQEKWDSIFADYTPEPRTLTDKAGDELSDFEKNYPF